MYTSALRMFAGGAITAATMCYAQMDTEARALQQDYVFNHAKAPEEMSFDYYQFMSHEQVKEIEQFKSVQSFATNLLENMKDIEPDFALTVERHFWDLV